MKKKAKAPPAFRVSLRPYNGNLWVTLTKDAYLKAHQDVFKEPDVLKCGTEGRFSGGCGKDGIWTYLIFAEEQHTMAHEVAHVVLHVFERCGIDPFPSCGEPFCYLLSQILLDIGKEAGWKKNH